MADKKSKSAQGKGKDAKDKKAGKRKREDADGAFSIASNPRARASIRRAKGWGGLIAFGFAFYLSYQASVPLATAAGRALIAGIGGCMVAWALSVTFWRHLMIAEVRRAAALARAKRLEAIEKQGSLQAPTLQPSE